MAREEKKKVVDAFEWEFDKEWFKDLQSKAQYNVYQSEYYERLSEETYDELYKRKAERTLACSKIWNLNYYIKHGIKQIESIVRCNDAFCYICQSLKAQRRFEIYSPILRDLEHSCDIYHIVFTVPNVTGKRLKWTLDKMYDRFGRLMEYFRGSKKIKGIDFGQYGYLGAVRTLEITTGKKREEFHPHFHCMFALAKNAPNMEKIKANSFSYGDYDFVSQQKELTLFSQFEWLLQRIWCLLMLDVKVTVENILNVYEKSGWLYKDGFDVKADKAEPKPGKPPESAYHEIFKYVVKGTYKKEKIFTYEEFCYLEGALYNRHVYQTYGCLRQYDFNEVDDIFTPKTQADFYFETLLQELQRREKPIVIQSCIEEILKELDGNKRRVLKIRYIGPATLRRAFSQMSEQEKIDCFEKMRKVLLKSYNEVISTGL